MGRAAELRAAAPVVRVDVLDVADEAVADDHARRAEDGPATLHRTGLEHAAVLLLRGDDLAGLVNGEREGLFAVDVLAGLHRLDGDVGVPVVRRRDADHVDGRILQHVAEVGDGLAGALDLPLRIVVVDALGAVLAAVLVAVATHDDLGAAVVLAEELRQQGRAALNAEADHRDVGLLAGRELARGDLGGGTAHERDRCGRAEEEMSSVEIHWFFLLTT